MGLHDDPSVSAAPAATVVAAATGYAVQHPDDHSLMTYRGHAVLQTLIRAYFSPAHTTGQRYIYAGNADGDILVWDVVSGKQVCSLVVDTYTA
jgi:WD repeat-containing protein 23